MPCQWVRTARLIVAGALVCHAAALTADPRCPEAPRLEVSPVLVTGEKSDRLFRVELARTAEQRATGLMCRRSLASGSGMLFLYPQPVEARIWMKDTLIALDVLFVDANGRVVKIADNLQPGEQHRTRSEVPVSAVLELPAGDAVRHGIQVGDRVHQTEVQVVSEAVEAVKWVEGLEHPWALAFLPDGRMIVTERPGRLRIIENGQLQPRSIGGLPDIAAQGQGGLLDVAVHPQFSDNQWIYLSYSAPGAGGLGTHVGRGRLQGLQLVDWQTLFQLEPKTNARQHFGSRLVFGRDGLLYITLGDRGDRDRAQDLSDPAGSVLRIRDDGSIPSSNPFLKDKSRRPEIYSYGHRNPQGAALHPLTGQLWVHEHGPQGGDEINIVRAGGNYGWPVITYGREYVTGFRIGEGTAKPGMEQPLHYWVPSIAPSGMAFYTGNRFPDWRNNLFVGALKDQMLVRLVLKGNTVVQEERLLKSKLGRIRDVREGPDGYLYLLTDAANGALYRLQPR